MDENERAFDVIRQATDEDAAGPERLAHVIRDMADALAEGVDPDELAEQVWPRVCSIVTEALGTNAAAELGRRGGKKGGKARAARLTPEERSESARKAARARWGGDT